MKITKLRFENVRSHVATTVELPGKISVFRGANHVGKSSIEHGIQFGLCSRSEGTNAAGAGAETTILRPGTEKAVIQMELLVEESLSKLRCSYTPKSGRTITTKDADGADTTGVMNPWLRDNAAVLSCLLNSRHFVTLKPAEQKDILAGIVLPDSYEFDAEMIEAAKCYTGILPVKPFDLISHVYDIAFEERKSVNRDIKNFQMPTGDIADAGDVNEMKTKLAERRNQLAAARTKRTNLIAASERVKGQRATVQARINAAESKMDDANRSLTEANSKRLEKKALKQNQEMAKQKAVAEDLDRKIISAGTELANIKAAIKKADELGDKCATCAQAITEEVKTAILAPMVERRNVLGSNLKDLQEQRAAIGDFTLAAQAVRDHEGAERDVIRATERAQEAQTELRGAHEDLAAVGEYAEVDTTEVDAEIADLETRIGKGTEVITRITVANDRKAAQDIAAEKLKTLKAKQALLERLVDYFGPKGIKATLLDQHVTAFVASMNAVLEAWGYQCFLRFEPEFSFGIVTTVADSEIQRVWPLNTLSKSEQYRFAIAFQVALAMHSGFRFVVIDEMDMLDQQGRNGLMGRLIGSDLDQAIVIGTNESTAVPNTDAATFYMVTSEDVDGIPTSTVSRMQPSV